MSAPAEQSYGWSHAGNSQGGRYVERFGQPLGESGAGPGPSPWSDYRTPQPVPQYNSMGVDVMSYPPPDLLPAAGQVGSSHHQPLQEGQPPTQLPQLAYPQPAHQRPQEQSLQQAGPEMSAQGRRKSRSRSRSRDRYRDCDYDRDRDRDRRDRDRDSGRDRDREREYSSRHASSSLERDMDRARDREGEKDRDREKRDDSCRSSRRSRSPDRRQRSRSRSRSRYDYRYDGDRDRHERDRGGYDRSRGRDDDRYERDRSREDRDRERDRRDERDRYDRRYGRDDDDNYGRRRTSSRTDDLDDGRRSHSADPDAEGVDTWRSRRGQPSTTVHVRNIPVDRDEPDLRQLFEGFPGLVSVKLVRSRTSGVSRGNAFVEFATEQDAAVLMETKARHGLQLGGNTLWLEYAYCVPALPTAPPAANSLDWICDMCSAVNFARRIECHKCSTARPSNPQRAAAEAHGPSPILKVSNLEPHVTDEDLRAMFLAHISVKDVRLVLDRYTGLPRGLAFIEMFSVGEAARALGLLQGATPPGSTQPLRLCYARDKFGGTGTGPSGTSAGAEALEAAQAMSMYSNWEPKAFDARALDGTAGQEGKHEQLSGTELGNAGVSGSSSAQQAQGQSHGQTPNGFVYDQASGYWYDAESGYYYDANTGLYYHRSTNQWYSYDHATGQYAAVGTGGSTGSETGAAGGGGFSEPATASAAARQQLTLKPSTKPANAGATGSKRPGAVIGAAPVLNAQGLLAAAALAEEKSRMAQKASQHQQAKQQGKQQAVKVSAQQPLARLHAASAQAPTAPAQVQGVIHRGKWAQRTQQ